LPCPQDAAATADQQWSSSEGQFKQDTTDEWDARFVVKNGNRRAVDQR
jgi:hypothetical protein